MTSPWVLVVVSVVLSLALTLGVLALVFGAIRRSVAREAASLREVELDSGPIRLVTRYRNFRTSRVYRHRAIRGTPAQIVLTRTHLHILERPQRYGVFTREQLPRFIVGITDGRLHLRSTEPPDATGEIDYRVRIDDPDSWVRALVAAGAKAA